MHPNLPRIIRHHHFCRAVDITPIPLHQKISTDGQFARGIDRKYLAAISGVHDLGFNMRHEPADGINALVDRIVSGGHRRHGARLRHAVANSQLSEVEHLMQSLHELRRNTTSSSDARPQLLKPLTGDLAAFDEIELFQEHGRHAVQRGTLLVLDSLEGSARVERLRGEHDG